MPLSSTYDVSQSYDWNYEHGPVWQGDIPTRPASVACIDFLGFKLRSRLGVPAGPLLNSTYVGLYAKLGWDVPVYKTVRSIARACHPTPNCTYVDAGKQLLLTDAEGKLVSAPEPAETKDISITNSFGMPSKEPPEWQEDIGKAHAAMGEGQLCIVSVVATPGLQDRDLIEDFAHTAWLAKQAGAKVIELNFSCPNVVSGEGDLYADTDTSSRISERVRQEIGHTPFLLKMGALPAAKLEEVVRANMPYCNGFAGINTIRMEVRNPAGEPALPGENRLKSGICGACIREVSSTWARDMVDIRKKLYGDYVLVGVGGMMTEDALHERIEMGMDLVMSATGAMWDPLMASRYHATYSA